MAFHSVPSLSLFNSHLSAQFLADYEKAWEADIREAASGKPSQAFAPSGFRCGRKQWFRIRGVEVDGISEPDKVFDFLASIGTACHQLIQSRLQKIYGADWISIPDYMKSQNIPGTYQTEQSGAETLVEFFDPYPIRMACDGVLQINGEYILVEIKSVEYSAWKDLNDIKPGHLDQVHCYGMTLNLRKVLFIYVDRLYGNMKCFEYEITEGVVQGVRSKMEKVLECVKSSIAPERLPTGDYSCSYCDYKKKCQEYG